MTDTALALIELCSVARGYVVVDALLKRAPVRLYEAGAVMPGKFLVWFGGGVEEVLEALEAGRRAAGDTLIDRLLLPWPHPALTGLLRGERAAPAPESALGFIEGYSLTGVARAADAALKAASVEGLWLDRSAALGGKALFACAGALHDVEAAVLAGTDALGAGLLVAREIIAAPDADLPAG